jgi:hypothetical protein
MVTCAPVTVLPPISTIVPRTENVVGVAGDGVGDGAGDGLGAGVGAGVGSGVGAIDEEDGVFPPHPDAISSATRAASVLGCRDRITSDAAHDTAAFAAKLRHIRI